MRKIEELGNDLILGCPLGSSRWVGEPIYEEITAIRITCGGGLGGSSWLEYVKRIDLTKENDDLIKVTRIDGKVITINRRYVVSTEDYTLVTMNYQSYNYHYPNEIWEDYKTQKLIQDGETVTLAKLR